MLVNAADSRSFCVPVFDFELRLCLFNSMLQLNHTHSTNTQQKKKYGEKRTGRSTRRKNEQLEQMKRRGRREGSRTLSGERRGPPSIADEGV